MGVQTTIKKRICFAGSPVELDFFVLPGLEASRWHVHGFGLSRLDVGIDDPECISVVGLHRGWGLWMSHFV